MLPSLLATYAARVQTPADFDDVGANLFFGAGTQVVATFTDDEPQRRRDPEMPCTK